MIIHTDAIILNRMKYKNSGLIARILTQEYGKISVIVNGASKQKGNLFGVMEPPNMIKINYYQKKTSGLQTFKEASFLHNNLNIKKDILKLGVSLVMVETIDKTIRENDVHIDIYNLTYKMLRILNECETNPKLILSYFLLHIIKELGYMPNLKKHDNNLSVNQTINNILNQLNECSYNDLMQMNINNDKLMDIISYLENYLIEHLQLTQKIKSLTMIKDLVYE